MSDWSFEDFYLWKNTYAACSSLQQSPININTDELKDCNLMCQLETDYKNSKCRLQYTKTNMIVLKYDYGSRAKFNGVYYNLTDVLIFTPSMHTVDNEKFEVEVMMVHKTDQSGNKDAKDNGIITCKLLNRYNREHGPEQDFFNEFFFKIPKEPFKDEGLFETIDVSKRWNADLLNPKERTSFYMYDGSLPYPPCTEKFKVIVYEEIGNIGDTNFQLLKENVGKNNRPIQDLGSRKIFYNPGRILKSPETHEDTFSHDKFLRCVKREEEEAPPDKEEENSGSESPPFVNEKLTDSTYQSVKGIFMFITFVSIIVLSYLFTKYLYRLMYIQKALKVFLPMDIFVGVEETWKACSATTGISMSDNASGDTKNAPAEGNVAGAGSGNAEASKNNASK